MPDSFPNLDVDATTTLRPVTPADAPALFDLVDTNRPHLRQWLPWVDRTLSVADTRAFIDTATTAAGRSDAAAYVIHLPGGPAGVVGVNRIDLANRVLYIGYWLAEAYCGRGLMTASVARLVRHAFDDRQLHRAVILANPENARSRGVAERLGFKLEGTLRQAEWLNGAFVDQVMYAKLRSD